MVENVIANGSKVLYKDWQLNTCTGTVIAYDKLKGQYEILPRGRVGHVFIKDKFVKAV